MAKKVVFLDIDGTLCGSSGIVPVRAREAVKAARAAGHLIFLCSGRSKSEIPEQIFQIGFDGLVGGAGASVEYNGELLFHQAMPKEKVAKIAEYMEKHRAIYTLESDSGMYVPEYAIEGLKQRFLQSVEWRDSVFLDFFERIQPFADYRTIEDINKITYFEAPTPMQEILDLFGEDFTIVSNSISDIGDNSGEISEKGMNKAVGVRKIMEKLQIPAQDIIAIGDGMNDIEMLEAAGFGVAMGNAAPKLKEIADMITSSVDEDGVYRCFMQLGLIEGN